MIGKVRMNIMRVHRWLKRFLLIPAIFVFSLVLTGCVESSFVLAPESRLPRFVALPPGLTRADVSLEMSYYLKPWGSGATFRVRSGGRVLAKLNGRLKGSEPLQLKSPPPGFPPGYPLYEVITANGVTEIIEHRKMEPVFYVSDDEAVRKELLGGGAASHP